MTYYRWKMPLSADWNVGADWDQGSVPNALTADAVIAAIGSYTVTYGSLDNGDVVNSLTLGAGAATLAVSSLLSIGGSHQIQLQAGTLALGSGAVLQNGTITIAGGRLAVASGATLDHDTIIGRLSVSANASVTIKNGLSVLGAGGVGPGTIDLLNNGAALAISDTETLDNVSILVGSTNSSINTTFQSLTFGRAAQVIQRSGYAQILAAGNSPAITNRGLFTLAGGRFDVSTLSNAGTIALTSETVNQSGTLTNSGLIAVGAAGTFDASSAVIGSTGSITVAAGGTLKLGTIAAGGVASVANSGTVLLAGSYGLSVLSPISGGGQVQVDGTLDLGAGTLDVLAGTAAGNVATTNRGVIKNGTILRDGGTIALAGATLDHVTVAGGLTLAASTTTSIRNGFAITSGAAPRGTLDLTATGAALAVTDNETLDNIVVVGGGLNTSGSGISLQGSLTLTLGTNFLLQDIPGTYAFRLGTSGYAASVVNAGSIQVAGVLGEYANNFRNTGSLAVLAGGTVTGNSGASGTYTNAGQISVAAGGTLTAYGSFSNTGTVALAAGGTLQIGGAETLAALGVITGAGTLDIIGTLDLAGGTITVGTGGYSNLRISGVVKGGTIKQTDGSLSFGSAASLVGDTLLGNFAPQTTVSVHESGGLAVKTAAGTSPGTIDLTHGASLFVDDAGTLDNVLILGGGSTSGSLGDSGTLTLGSNAVYTQSTNSFNFAYSSGELDNAGQITLLGGTLNDYATKLINTGTISVTGGLFTLLGGRTLTDNGVLNIGGAGTLTVASTSVINGTGTIAIAAGGTLQYNSASLSLATLPKVSGAGQVVLSTSTLDLGGGTLDIKPTTGLTNLLVTSSSTLQNGTVIKDGGSLTFGSNITLSNMTVRGVLVTVGIIYTQNGLSVLSVDGTQPGTIDLASTGYNMTLTSSETLDNLTLLPGQGSVTLGDVNETLTLGVNARVLQTRGSTGFVGQYTGDQVINKGTVSVLGGSVTAQVRTFENAGLIAIGSGGTFAAYSNYALVNDADGTIAIGSYASFALSSTNVLNNAGRIAVAAFGTFSDAATALGFTNTGTVALDANATFAVGANLKLSDLGTVTGGGTLAVNSGQTLDLGGGTLELGAAQSFATLRLAGSLVNGTLKYDSTGGLVLPNTGTIAASVTLSGSNAIGAQTTISTLNNLGGGTLDIKRGTATSNVLLSSGGTLSNGTLKLEDGLFAVQGGTLNAITVLGSPVLLSAATITGGLTVKTASGASPGTLTLGNYANGLYVADNETLDNLSIVYDAAQVTVGTSGTGTLTLGANATLIGNAPAGNYDYVSGNVINRGQILLNGAIYFNGISFTNAGTITTAGTSDFYESGTSFNNTGLLSIAVNTTADISSTNFANTGSIAVAAGGTLNIASNITSAALANVSVALGGVLRLTGTVDFAGGTLDVAPVGAFSNVVLAGTVKNATIKPDGGTVALGGTLDHVTFLGVQTLSSAFTVRNGLVVETAAGGFPGTLTTAPASYISVSIADTETLDNLTFALVGGNDSLNAASSATLTLGSNTTLTATGTTTGHSLGGSGLLVNRGQIQVATGLIASVTSLMNAGTISTTGAGDFIASGSTFSNNGLLAIGAGGTAEFRNNTFFANTGQFTVAAGGTLSLQGAYTLANLGSIAVAAGGLVSVTGTLDLGGGTLDVAPGNTFGNLALTGLIRNGTIKPDGGTLALGGTLDNVTLLGAATTASQTYLRNGLVAETASGSLPGTLTLNAGLSLLDSETLDNISFLLLGNGVALGAGSNTLTLGAGAVATIASVSGSYNYLSGTKFVNAGQILTTSLLYENATTFINSGTVVVSGIGDFSVQTGNFTNAGLLSIGAGATADISYAATLSNTGQIAVASGGTLNLYGTYTLANLGSIVSATGGVINLTGTLDLGGGTIDLKPGTSFGDLRVSGVLKNGTVLQDGGTLISGGGTFDALNVTGSLASTNAVINLRNGLTLSGSIDLTSGYNLNVLDSETLDNTVITMAASAYITPYATLTLGGGLRIAGTGPITFNNNNASSTIVNLGTIALSNGTASINTPSFINNGTMLLTAAETVNLTNTATAFRNTGLIEATANSGVETFAVGTGRLTNFSLGTLTGGAYRVDDGTTLDLSIGGAVTTDAATLVLSGPNAALMLFNAASTYAPIETTLATIAATGTLQLLAGRSWTGITLVDNGLVQLAGGVFSTPSLTISATGTVAGFGTLQEGIGNAGLIVANGGQLVLSATPTGAGTERIDAGATLELATASANAVTFNGLGARLRIDVPNSYTGTLTNVAAGDGLLLQGVAATAASSAGTTLTVTLQGGGTETFTTSAALTGIREGVTQDGLGNSAVVFYRYAGASTASAIAFANHHVGDSVTSNVPLANTSANDGYSELLNASIGSPSAGITVTGTIALLAPGAVSSNGLSVTLLTATAGAKSETATISPQTDGTGIDANPAIALPTQSLSVTGKVYNYATAAVSPNPVAFANHHVGDLISQAITLSNTATAGLFSENLNAAFSAASGGLTDSGTVSQLAAGSIATTPLAVTLASGTAGTISGAATLALVSDGGTIDGLGTTALASQVINASGKIYNYATAAASANTVVFANHHVGDAISQAITLSNTAAAGAYSENFDAAFSAARGGLADSGIVAGLTAGSASSALSITLASGTAGAISGAATIALVSDGGTIDGLGTTVLASQVINAAGSVYNYATASAAPTTIAFANHHVGDAVTQAITLSNTSAAGAFSEKLNAAFSAASGGLVDSGSVAGLSAGASSSALAVTLATGTAGAISGAATIALASDGGTIDGLGTTVLASQVINASGSVYNYATASAAPTTIAFANHHVGDTVTQAITLSNTAAANGFSENLNAAFSAASGGLADSGSIAGLAAGATSSALAVTLATGTAGAITGAAAIALVSDGGGIDGLGTTALASQVINASGSVFNYATASAAPTTIVFANHHVGDTVTQAITLSNTAAPGAFSEKLNAVFSAASGGLADSGSVAGLTAGASSSALAVTLATGTAGAISGAATIALASDGGTIDGLGTTVLANQVINAAGRVYNYATASLTGPTAFDDGVHHVGDTVVTQLTLSNAATTGAFSELLDAGFVGISGAVTAAGTIATLAAGSISTVLAISLTSAASGIASGAGTLAFESNGGTIDGLGQTALANQTVSVAGTFDNYATAALSVASGATLSGSGGVFTLDFGTLTQAAGFVDALIGVFNAANGTADALDSAFGFNAGNGFVNTGFAAVNNESAGGNVNAGTISLNTSAVGQFSETFTFAAYGTNASGYIGALPNETVMVTGTVVACFVRGTLIRTPDGDRPVEELAIGDLVTTLDGAAPLRWIGRRSYAGRFLIGRDYLLPVRICANAIEDGVPSRDLLVSPKHAMAIDGALVPAELLVNGVSILNETAMQRVDYFHLELADHAIIIAENAPTETFLDDDSRMLFHNAYEYFEMYPDAPQTGDFCLPRLEDGFAVEAIRTRLEVRAGGSWRRQA